MECIKKYLYQMHIKGYRYYRFHTLLRRSLDIQTSTISCRQKCVTHEPLFMDEEDEETKTYNKIRDEYFNIVTGGHKAFVIQPYIKWGRDKKRNTSPELQLAEAVALINTLPNWVVAGKTCIPLLSLQKKKLLGSGNLEKLRDKTRQDRITALFISTNVLKQVQIYELQKIFGVPVYDRYSIVIQIFRQHARSPEAKLQVALAEIPYIWKKTHENNKQQGAINLTEIQKRILQDREKKIKEKIKKLKEHRKLLRKHRTHSQIPSIAIVGYTNAGKTSLIKALTDDKSLNPEDKLFATLDTTAHQGFLPSRLKVLYMDTIGFIQDVPETLIEPFNVTLEDAMISDIIVHIYDISHPDMEAQYLHVEETIKPMIDANKPIIRVANKYDLIDKSIIPNNAIAVSATKLIGIDVLRLEIEKVLMTSTGRIVKRIRVQSGSQTTSWLYKHFTVINEEPDPNNMEYLILDIIISKNDMYKLKQIPRQ